MISLVGLGLRGAVIGMSGGTGGAPTSRGAGSLRYDSKVSDTLTRSLKNGLVSPQNRASTVFTIEQWSSVMPGPLPGGVHGDTTNVGTRTP